MLLPDKEDIQLKQFNRDIQPVMDTVVDLDVANLPLQSQLGVSDQSPDSPALQLPWDSLKTNFTPYNPQYFTFALPSPQVDWLRSRMQEYGFEERPLLLAAFSALLYRYTQQEAIPLILTVSDPQSAESCTTEFHAQVHGQLQVQELINHVSTHLEQFSKQSYSSVLPLAEIGRSDRSPAPLIAVTFVDEFICITDQDSSLLNLQTQHSELAFQPDWHLILFQQKQGITGVLKYNASLFVIDTIQRVIGHWQMFVEGMANHPACPIAQLPLLTPAEIHQLTVEWESPLVSYPAIPIHQYIETHTTQQPEAIAVTFKEQQLSYQELNQRANLLAHYLINAGVGKEARVAVCLEPSLEVAVSLLAILKAGGIYVPLDPTHPVERIATILEDNQPQVLLTRSHLLPSLTTVAATKVFCVDRDWESVQAFSLQNPGIEIDLEQTAYLVYTSGTTGKPKGVMASHGNLAQYILSARDYYGFNQQDVIPAIARFTFSINMFELLTPLVSGGRLLILERDQILNFKRMVQVLEQVTVIHASPSLWRKLLPYILENGVDNRKFQSLRHVSAGGDIVPADLLETMKRVFQTAEIFVIYGCSEISCMGCTYPVLRGCEVTKTWVGKPFSNMAVRLFDRHQNLVPIGISGEIYFSGSGVTKGYLNREELTQERFVTIDGQRFYRTGDLGRFDAHGNLEILGRSDFQIKLRGIRIEPAEIEANLRQAPGVRDGVVVARALGSSEKNLVAYIVLEQPELPEIEPIRQFLQTKLPDYMVPAAFVVLDAMPVNINQKVDRNALPAPTPENLVGLKTIVQPRNDWEQQLVEIWENALGIQPIGIQNNFFEMGGDSLKAVQILMQIEARWNKALPITIFLDVQTVETLAEAIRNAGEESVASDIVPLRRSGSKPPLFFLYGILFYQELANHLDIDRTTYGVFLQEEVELVKVGKYDATKSAFFSVPGLATRYLESIRSVQPHGPYYLAGHSFGGLIAFEMAHQLRALGEEVALLVLFDSWLLSEKLPLHRRLKIHWDRLLEQGVSHLLERIQNRIKIIDHKITAQKHLEGNVYTLDLAERLVWYLFRVIEFVVPLIHKLNGQMYSGASEISPMINTAIHDGAWEEIREDVWDKVRNQAARSYSPKPYPGKLVLFRATEPTNASATAPVNSSASSFDPKWSPLVTGGLEVYDIPGTHKGIMRAPHVSILAQRLQAYLQ